MEQAVRPRARSRGAASTNSGFSADTLGLSISEKVKLQRRIEAGDPEARSILAALTGGLEDSSPLPLSPAKVVAAVEVGTRSAGLPACETSTAQASTEADCEPTGCLVKTRWGLRRHSQGCTCKCCKFQRAQASSGATAPPTKRQRLDPGPATASSAPPADAAASMSDQPAAAQQAEQPADPALDDAVTVHIQQDTGTPEKVRASLADLSAGLPEGCWVQSREGFTQHRLGCTCIHCRKQRAQWQLVSHQRAQAALQTPSPAKLDALSAEPEAAQQGGPAEASAEPHGPANIREPSLPPVPAELSAPAEETLPPADSHPAGGIDAHISEEPATERVADAHQAAASPPFVVQQLGAGESAPSEQAHPGHEAPVLAVPALTRTRSRMQEAHAEPPSTTAADIVPTPAEGKSAPGQGRQLIRQLPLRRQRSSGTHAEAAAAAVPDMQLATVSHPVSHPSDAAPTVAEPAKLTRSRSRAAAAEAELPEQLPSQQPAAKPSTRQRDSQASAPSLQDPVATAQPAHRHAQGARHAKGRQKSSRPSAASAVSVMDEKPALVPPVGPDRAAAGGSEALVHAHATSAPAAVAAAASSQPARQTRQQKGKQKLADPEHLEAPAQSAAPASGVAQPAAPAARPASKRKAAVRTEQQDPQSEHSPGAPRLPLPATKKAKHPPKAKGLRFEMAALARDGMVVDVQEGRRTRHAQQQQAPSQPPTPTVSEPPPVPQPPVPTPATSAQRKQGSSSSRRTGGAQLGEVQQQALPAQDEEQQPAADAQLERSSGRQKRGAALQAASAIARQAASRPSSADQAEAEDATSLGAGAHDGVAAEDASATSSAVPKQRTKSQGKPSGHAQKNGKLAGLGEPVSPEDADAARESLIERLQKMKGSKLWPRDSLLNMRMLLRSCMLAGQPVQYRHRKDKVTLLGAVADDGNGIACSCAKCKGAVVSPSEFEEHAGSKERRPGECIFLTGVGISFKDLCYTVNGGILPPSPSPTPQPRSPARGHASKAQGSPQKPQQQCSVCWHPGKLLVCGGCGFTAHAHCAGLFGFVPSDAWHCDKCQKAQSAGAKAAPKPPAGKADGPAKRKSGAMKNGRKASAAAVAASSVLSPEQRAVKAAADTSRMVDGGRVHLALPASRGLSMARRGRDSNKHKRLFVHGQEGGLRHGEKVSYITSQGETLLQGRVHIDPSPHGQAGIWCNCCRQVISCSAFEAHAGRGSRRAPYDNIFTDEGVTLRKRAELLPNLEPDANDGHALAAVADGTVTEVDNSWSGGGCALCASPDFERDEFGPNTVLICDQCEREYHVGCLKDAGMADLQALPEGEWFCCSQCGHIRDQLTQQVGKGPIPMEDELSWQVLRGVDGTDASADALAKATALLQESFDPIIDVGTGQDLVPAMVYAQALGDWDFTGMLTLILYHQAEPVCVAVSRVFGTQAAELPLVATASHARRRGYARIMLAAFDDVLAQVGARSIVLPAARETIETWVHGFGFGFMDFDQESTTRRELRVLVFPGTRLLYRKTAAAAKEDQESVQPQQQAPQQPQEQDADKVHQTEQLPAPAEQPEQPAREAMQQALPTSLQQDPLLQPQIEHSSTAVSQSDTTNHVQQPDSAAAANAESPAHMHAHAQDDSLPVPGATQQHAASASPIDEEPAYDADQQAASDAALPERQEGITVSTSPVAACQGSGPADTHAAADGNVEPASVGHGVPAEAALAVDMIASFQQLQHKPACPDQPNDLLGELGPGKPTLTAQCAEAQ